ncbi:M48 family metallopeptidase [Vitreoscilla massiliensis]|uniref:M48 family metallopeptidase n=1 Tax=Vitreoscilla massiliensis TaxID=1689272 RepID=A0ABY4E288_9NEIS|nr:M48 family metallopeptidase [Vitreoscilla massiliensis]UOO88905.1 M48 family metallopeptidase [Vitreoscilla massiliensis]
MNVKLTAALLCSSVFLGACANNMTTGDMLSLGASGMQALTLSDSQLRDTANLSCAQMDKANSVAAAGSKYNQRLNNIKKGLPTSIDGVALNYKVYQTRDINAWAMPNGCIRVYSGLMDMMTDDEVRGVLGHEIGHVQLGHSKNRFRVAALASLGREVLAKSGNSTIANLNASELGDLSEKFLNAQFSQKQESDADDYSYNLLVSKGLSPKPLATSFEKLSKMSGGKGSVFDSHPGSDKRAQRIYERMAKDGKK